MTDFEVGDRVEFAGGKGTVSEVIERPSGGAILQISTGDGQRKLPSSAPGLEKIDSISDRLATGQVDDPMHVDLRERATRLDLAYRYDRFLSLKERSASAVSE